MTGISHEIRTQLFTLQDMQYRDFQSALLPTLDRDSVIGVRTPALRKLARELAGREDIEDFLTDLPHLYFEENNLHFFILERTADFEKCLAQVQDFLPCVDNWATCDQACPKTFKLHRKELLPYIREWMESDRIYTVRFGMGMLMRLFLDEDFSPEYPQMVAVCSQKYADTTAERSEEYYVSMMAAWYFATALAKQWDAALPYIEERRLPRWTHNKTIQKACESRRISPTLKEYLRSLKWN